MLVFCFLSQPCYVHPQISRAFVMIRNFWRFVHGKTEVCHILELNFDRFLRAKHSLIKHVSAALKFFHMEIFPNLQVGIGETRFHVLDFSFREIRALLFQFGHQFCYEQSGIKPRKDLARPTGIIDTHLSMLFKRKYKPPTNTRENLIPHLNLKLWDAQSPMTEELPLASSMTHVVAFASPPKNLCST